MVSYGSTSFTASSGSVTAVSISSLGVSDGAAASEGDYCTCVVSCPGVGSPNPETWISGAMSGFVYIATTVAEPARAPSSPCWVACADLNWTPAAGSPAEVKTFRVPAGASRVAWLPDSALMSNGSALLVLSACKRSGF